MKKINKLQVTDYAYKFLERENGSIMYFLRFFISSADSLAAEATCSVLEDSVVSILSLKESIAVLT